MVVGQQIKLGCKHVFVVVSFLFQCFCHIFNNFLFPFSQCAGKLVLPRGIADVYFFISMIIKLYSILRCYLFKYTIHIILPFPFGLVCM